MRGCREPGARCVAEPRGAGFTLLELLVAIGILAMVSIIAWRGLSALIATRDRLQPEADNVRTLLTSFGQMQQDLAQAANPVLISLGRPPVRVLVVDGTPTLQILRLAPEPGDDASAVQQVTYSVVDGALVRLSTAPARSVAIATSASANSTRLMAGVASMRVRFWRPTLGWIVPDPAEVLTPPGVEVELTRADGTRYRRVMLVG